MIKILSLLLLMLLMFTAGCGTVASAENLVVYFLDVGQADAAILQCGDEVMMIDGGESSDSSLIYSYLTKTLGITHIDYMIATHPHADHIGGLSGALNACSVGVVYSPVTSYDSKQFSSLVKYTQKQGRDLTVPEVGDSFAFGDAQVQFLSPAMEYSNVNDCSIVVRITHGSNTFLFAGDAEWDAEHDMLSSGYDLSATVLKVGHHGSDTSSSYVFLREVMPKYAVISCGEGNSYGHPTEAVLSRLRDAGTQVFRTDLQGGIMCVSDGNELTFAVEKNADYESIWQGADSYVPVLPPAYEEAEKPDSSAAVYIGNKNSKKFHYASCSSVKDMKEKNKVELNTREEAIEKGYVPCKNCNP